MILSSYLDNTEVNRDVNYLDMLHQKVDQKFVTFEVQPQPKLIMTSYEFNYTCSTGEDDADVMYTWNKIDFVSRTSFSQLTTLAKLQNCTQHFIS